VLLTEAKHLDSVRELALACGAREFVLCHPGGDARVTKLS
jgi:hypothetical protein